MMLKIMLNDIHNIIDGFMFPISHRLWSAIVPMCYNRNIRPDIVILNICKLLATSALYILARIISSACSR